MVLASGRWFGVRTDLLCAAFVGLVALVCVRVSLDAGNLHIIEIILVDLQN